MEADVIIVGAGPAGVSAGQEIARSGYEVLILEKERASSRRKSSGVAVPRKCFADLKLPEEIIERDVLKWCITSRGRASCIQTPGLSFR